MTFQLLTTLTAAAGLGMIGLAYNSYAAYFMFSALVALVFVAFVSSRLSGRVLELRRDVADRVFENDLFPIVLEVTNHGHVPLFLLKVTDKLARFLAADRALEFLVPALWPGETARLTYMARGLKRGVHRLGPVMLSVCDPFGLFAHGVELKDHGEAVIFPRPVPLAGEVVRSGAEPRPIATGERARGSESGLEFYGIRDYRPGDELRRIHWAATAHHNRLTVIEFDRGVSENLAVVLDTRVGTEYGTGLETSLELGVRAAASLLHWSLSGEGAASLALDSAEGMHWLETDRLDRSDELLELLARAQAEGSVPLSAALEWAVPLLPFGATVWVITAAPDPHLAETIATLVRNVDATGIVVALVEPESFDGRTRIPSDLEAELRIAGAVTVPLRRGDDLGEALGNVLSTAP